MEILNQLFNIILLTLICCLPLMLICAIVIHMVKYQGRLGFILVAITLLGVIVLYYHILTRMPPPSLTVDPPITWMSLTTAEVGLMISTYIILFVCMGVVWIMFGPIDQIPFLKRKPPIDTMAKSVTIKPVTSFIEVRHETTPPESDNEILR